MTEPDPHLLPDGSTSWGPDPEPCKVCGGRGWHTAGGNDPAACGACPAGEAWYSDSASSVPEPTEAMVEVATKWYRPPGMTEDGHRENMAKSLERAIAAAPPEWLLRAALEPVERLKGVLAAAEDEADLPGELILSVEDGRWEVEWCVLDPKRNVSFQRDTLAELLAALIERESRALRGGEET